MTKKPQRLMTEKRKATCDKFSKRRRWTYGMTHPVARMKMNAARKSSLTTRTRARAMLCGPAAAQPVL